jgi:hypothetical protein
LILPALCKTRLFALSGVHSEKDELPLHLCDFKAHPLDSLWVNPNPAEKEVNRTACKSLSSALHLFSFDPYIVEIASVKS